MDDSSAHTRELAAQLAAPGATAAPEQLRDVMVKAHARLLSLQARLDRGDAPRIADNLGAVHNASEPLDGGLVGPSLLADRLGQELAHAERQRQKVALVAISVQGYPLLKGSLDRGQAARCWPCCPRGRAPACAATTRLRTGEANASQ